MSITPISVNAESIPGLNLAVRDRMKNAATDFEALFIKQLMQFARMDLGKGVAGDTYQDWFHAALSDQMALRHPFGITESILSQLRGSANNAETLDKSQLMDMIRDTSQRHGLPAELLSAVMQVESGGNPNAVSSSGARGLMQLMPDTARMLEVRDSFDPQMNLDGGARYLKSLMDRYDGDLNRVLGAYNAGPGAVDRYNGVPPYPETERYIEKVRQEMSTGEEQ